MSLTLLAEGCLHIPGDPDLLLCAQGRGRTEACFVNSVYLDNSSLELYHSLLDKKPGATTMRVRCRPRPVPRCCALTCHSRAG